MITSSSRFKPVVSISTATIDDIHPIIPVNNAPKIKIPEQPKMDLLEKNQKSLSEREGFNRIVAKEISS
jgi:hypothetical protein